MKRVLLVLLAGVLALTLPAQKPTKLVLQSGPMVGYSEMREVMLWAQTSAPADVHIEYWRADQPNVRYRTNTVRTEKSRAYTAHLLADEVQPGTKYEYDVFLNGKLWPRPYPLRFQSQALWQFRTEPPAVKVAVGSCLYVNDPTTDRPGRSYGDTIPQPIVSAIMAQQPDAMIWLGDNTYTREPDYGSVTGLQYRYTHTRSAEHLQQLWGSVHHYATWDDHDYGPNDVDGSYALKRQAREIFKQFWANRTYGIPGTEEGICHQFQLADVDFFLLDDRWFRTANGRTTGTPQVLGEAQIQWLINALKNSRAPFKIIANGGQILNTAAKFENLINLAPQERERLLTLIREEKIEGVVFLSGDRHHAELSKLEQPGFYPIYEFTTSPLSAGAVAKVDEPNTLRVEGTLLEGTRNFGMLEFSGPRTDRTLTLRLVDKNGREVWRRDIKASELKVK